MVEGKKSATVIGTAGGASKCAIAKSNGYEHVIDYQSEDVVARVNEITAGSGVDAVYDSVGDDTASDLAYPPVAVWLGYTFLGERLDEKVWIGFLLIAIGLVITDGRLLKIISRNRGSQ